MNISFKIVDERQNNGIDLFLFIFLIIFNSLKTGIRHPEELSLCKPIGTEHLKQNYQDTLNRRRAPPPTKDGNTGERIDTNTFVANTSLVSLMCKIENHKHYQMSCTILVLHAFIYDVLLYVALLAFKSFLFSLNKLNKFSERKWKKRRLNR